VSCRRLARSACADGEGRITPIDALARGVEHIERVGPFPATSCSFRSGQADLWTVAVGDDKLMPCLEQRQERGDGQPYIGALRLGRHRLAAPQKRLHNNVV
jgi:hypothetical protein